MIPMTDAERIYYSNGERSLAQEFLFRDIQAVRSQREQIRRQVVERFEIRQRVKENCESHLGVLERYRLESLMRNSDGERQRIRIEGEISQLRREGRTHDLSAWQDVAPLLEEDRRLMREESKLLRKYAILRWEPGSGRDES